MSTDFRDWVDKTLNLSGGVYVGMATFVVLGLAISEYVAGTPMVVASPDGKAVTYIIHQAPQWFVGPVGVYTVILGLFWIGKPINTYVNSKAGATPTEPTPTPTEIPLQK